jgi:serine/threonine protein kinase
MNGWISDAALRHLRGLEGAPPDLGTDRYRILERLGEGGMGTVWRAVDRLLGREVAIKVVSDAAAGADSAARLEQEARILAQLEHPGIVPVHEVGRLADGRAYYVMKRVRGVRLDEAVRSESNLADRLTLFQRICEAVAFAHARGVVHRDLKPENVMVGEFGEVLVLDWGVAKRMAGDEPTPGGESSDPLPATDDMLAPGIRTGAGTVIGTPAYMSPEQRRGEASAVDRRADVYSLGALLHFLVAGRTPERSAQGEVVPLRRHDKTHPAALEAIASRAMATEPGDRYDGALDLAADVGRFQARERVQAYREPWPARVGRLLRRHRLPLLVVLGYLVVRAVLFFVAGR